MTVRVQLRDFVGQRLRDRGDTDGFDDDEALITGGRLDSLDVITMAGFLERSFGVELARRGFDQNDFDSVQNMLLLIEDCATARSA